MFLKSYPQTYGGYYSFEWNEELEFLTDKFN